MVPCGHAGDEAGDTSWPELNHLTLVVTEACDLKCGYCPQRRSPDRMKQSTTRAAVELLWRRGRGPAGLGFYGGEPLLEKELVLETMALARRRFRGSGRPLHFHLSTNGKRLDESLFLKLGRLGTKITLSTDGPPAAQALRCTDSVKAATRVLAWQQRHRLAGFATHSTVTPNNVHLLADSLRFLVEAGVEEIGLGYDHSVRWPRRAGQELARQAREVADLLSTMDHNPVAACQSRPPWSRPCSCSAGLATLSVGVSGLVYGCHVMDPIHGLGELWPAEVCFGPLEAFSPRRYQRRLRRLRSRSVCAPQDRRQTPSEACADCVYLHFCAVCPGETLRGAGGDPLLVPQDLCDRLKVMHRLTAQTQLLNGNRPSALGRLLAVGT